MQREGEFRATVLAAFDGLFWRDELRRFSQEAALFEGGELEVPAFSGAGSQGNPVLQGIPKKVGLCRCRTWWRGPGKSPRLPILPPIQASRRGRGLA